MGSMWGGLAKGLAGQNFPGQDLGFSAQDDAYRSWLQNKAIAESEMAMRRSMEVKARDYERDARPSDSVKLCRKPTSFREELQAETDEWLNDD